MPNGGFSVQRRNLLHKVMCYLLLVMGTKSLVKLENCLNLVPARNTHLHVLTTAALHVTVLLLLAELTTACHCSSCLYNFCCNWVILHDGPCGKLLFLVCRTWTASFRTSTSM